ncbi:hypothetical protein SAMD00019534_071040 [Acytostelium subglobosum LB1]|uniref:hypothetical protein n=1 Tax=Acytostelium subglobosum LB1 TaxID=1410327 RepID=UPI000645057F|nr:hypothetical protein SAMD00019534_071040 [Acytostelium subglobosum LB1]GAM23929.1 hypothetical protein SAMD00019534_071040 [Acytostelium subglobosum LB1]|eukprot:XP_012752965.1 hypothetical protein SAMD00019534_071040 [Acytostelium subglobosum LB1]
MDSTYQSVLLNNTWSIIDNKFNITDVGNDLADLSKHLYENLLLKAFVRDTESNRFLLCWWEGTKVAHQLRAQFRDTLLSTIVAFSNTIDIGGAYQICHKFNDEEEFNEQIDKSTYNGFQLFDQLPMLQPNEWFVFGYNSERMLQSISGQSGHDLMMMFTPNHSNSILYRKSENEYFYLLWEGHKTRPIERVKFTSMSATVFLMFKHLYDKIRVIKLYEGYNHEWLASVLGPEFRVRPDIPKPEPVVRVPEPVAMPMPLTKPTPAPVSTPVPLPVHVEEPVHIEPVIKQSILGDDFEFAKQRRFDWAHRSVQNSPVSMVSRRIGSLSIPSSPIVDKGYTFTKPEPVVEVIAVPEPVVEMIALPEPEPVISKVHDVKYCNFHDIEHALSDFNKGHVNWVMLGFSTKVAGALTLVGKGTKGLSEMKELLLDNTVRFSVYRVNFDDKRSAFNQDIAIDSNRQRTCLVEWHGKRSSASQKAKRVTIIKPVYNMISEKVLLHGEFEVDEHDDISDKAVIQKVTSFRNDVQYQHIIEPSEA